MKALAIIKDFDVVEELGLGLSHRSKRASVNQLPFKRAPKRLDGCIIIAVAGPAHRADDSSLSEGCSKITAGIGTAAIGMEEQLPGRLPVLASHDPGLQDQRAVIARAGRPAHDLAAVKIEHCGQIQPSLLSGDIRDIGYPHLIGSLGRRPLSQSIGREGKAMCTVGGADAITPFLANNQAPPNASNARFGCAHAVVPAGARAPASGESHTYGGFVDATQTTAAAERLIDQDSSACWPTLASVPVP